MKKYIQLKYISIITNRTLELFNKEFQDEYKTIQELKTDLKQFNKSTIEEKMDFLGDNYFSEIQEVINSTIPKSGLLKLLDQQNKKLEKVENETHLLAEKLKEKQEEVREEFFKKQDIQNLID